MAPAAPPRLSELQLMLSRVWTTPEGLDAALETEEGAKALRWILSAPPVSVRQRLAVYSDAYFLRLLEALGSDFPATKRALGDEAFRILIAEHLRANSSVSPNISDLGETLARTAERSSIPYASDLCRLEWAVLSSLYTDRLPPLDRKVFAKVTDWDAARLVIDPTLRLLEADWPVQRLWDERLNPPSKLTLERKATRLAVHRDEEWVRVRALKPKEFAVLKSISTGAALGRACADSRASAKELEGWFAAWSADGVIKGIR